MDLQILLFQRQMKEFEPLFPNIRKHISKNPNLTMDMVLQDIKQNPSKKHEWHFDNLCYVIPVDTLLEHGFVPQRMELVTPNLINVTIEMLKRTKNTIPWAWRSLIHHKDISIQDIVNNPDLPWNTGIGPCYNPNLTLQDILTYPHLFTDYLHIAYMQIGAYKVTYEEIIKHPDKPWSYNILANPTIKTLDQVRHLLTYLQPDETNKNTIMIMTCKNPNLCLKDLLDFFGTEVIKHLPYNPKITFEELLGLDCTDMNRCFYLMHYRVPLDYIIQHPEITWNWIDIIHNHKDITYDTFPRVVPLLTEDVKRTGHYTPNEYHLKTMFYFNKHLSLTDHKKLYEDLIRFVKKYPKDDTRDPPPLPNDYLFMSPFFLEPTFQEIKKYFAKKKIIRHLVEALSNPAYLQCRKRLTREHNTMQF